MAVVVVVFKLCIKAWTAHLTKNSGVPFWLPSFLTCYHLELGANFLYRFVLILSVSPFLIGQALWVASRFTPLMTQQLLARLVECVEFPPGVPNRILCGEAPSWVTIPYPFTYHFWQKRLPILYTFCWQMVPFHILIYLHLLNINKSINQQRLLALLDPFTGRSDRFPYPFIYFSSTNETPTLS